MALTAEEIDGQQLKSLKTLVAKQIGVPRFWQRWLSEDHNELGEEAFVIPSDVQLVVLDFVQAENGDAAKLRDACERNLLEEVEELLRKPMNPNMVAETVFPLGLGQRDGRTALHSAAENALPLRNLGHPHVGIAKHRFPRAMKKYLACFLRPVPTRMLPILVG